MQQRWELEGQIKDAREHVHTYLTSDLKTSEMPQPLVIEVRRGSQSR